jgi:SMC interacting uncharacterized protein involved in chromosome segregation
VKEKMNIIGGCEMSVYRKRNPQKILTEMEYIQEEIAKKEEELEKLQNKLNYLQSELAFNLREEK